MTAPDPRVGEIAARLSAATAGPWEMAVSADRKWALVLSRSGTAEEYHVARAVDDDDAEFIAGAPADIAYLLAELRDREGKLARVEGLAKYLDALADGDRHYAALIRAAVAAAGGGGDRG